MSDAQTPAWRPPKLRLPEIRQVGYRNTLREDLGVHCVDTDYLRALRSPEHFLGPQRLDFHQMLLFTEGHGVHTVDLVRYPVFRGTLLLVRPGQVQEWDSANWPRAKILVFHPSFLLPNRPEYRNIALPLPPDRRPISLLLSVPEFVLVEESMDEIRDEIGRWGGSSLLPALLFHLLYALLIRLRPIAEKAPPLEEAEGPAGIYRRFRLEVEQGFRTSRTVRSYAARLGYSETSLYRAIRASAGVSPKQLIDERVSLEAQRLLAHTRWPLTRISVELGFSEPTNFVKFFRRTTGQTPEQFRRKPVVQSA